MALLKEAGMADYEHELLSIEGDWRKDTTDAVGAQLRDAGIKVKRNVLPGSTFWNDWAKYPFSSTNWNMRPLGVQVLALAYRSGEAWNEAGFANKEFDDLLTQGTINCGCTDKRREVMAKDSKDHAGRRRDHPTILAFTVPSREAPKVKNAAKCIRPLRSMSDQMWMDGVIQATYLSQVGWPCARPTLLFYGIECLSFGTNRRPINE